MKPLVLVIDDNVLPLRMYTLALEQAGLTVKHCRSTDEALREAQTVTPAAVVLDIMMPPGTFYQDKDTEDGLKTGIFLYQDLRVRFPYCPFFILTNVTDPELLAYFHAGPLLHLISKEDYTPVPFAARVRQALQMPNPKLTGGQPRENDDERTV
jgi:CheY-like chemotaxis protein